MAGISVIVPVLDEEERVADALLSAREAFGPRAELLVVDGGSRDRTREVARALARVIDAEPGRGLQLAAGARAARGEILVFLHADTRLPPDAAAPLRRLLARPGVAGGCFRFALEPPPGSSRWRALEAGIRLRTRLFRTATGDQVLFASREAYRKSGGYPPWPLFEDVEFVRRLRSVGAFRVLPLEARTSRRRWERTGFWRTVGTHWLLRAAYAAGVAPRRLARWYARMTGELLPPSPAGPSRLNRRSGPAR